jgi:hypothetical protein
MLAGYLEKLKKSPEELAALMQPIKRITQGIYMIGELKVYMKVYLICYLKLQLVECKRSFGCACGRRLDANRRVYD